MIVCSSCTISENIRPKAMPSLPTWKITRWSSAQHDDSDACHWNYHSATIAWSLRTFITKDYLSQKSIFTSLLLKLLKIMTMHDIYHHQEWHPYTCHLVSPWLSHFVTIHAMHPWKLLNSKSNSSTLSIWLDYSSSS